MRIGIVAGEASGDLLGAGLIQAIKKIQPDARFEGIGGPKMIAQGCESFFPMERLSVMGLIEPLSRFRELLNIRKQIIQRFKNDPPDLFIGIDAPDFNFGVERKLKQANIKTVHYVSPSIWAWREYRVKKMMQSMDLMLVLFPFEVDFYKKYNIPVKFVGHTSADTIPLIPDTHAARATLDLPSDAEIIAILPGSRVKELHYMVDDFISGANLVYKKRPAIQFIAPMANDKIKKLFEQALRKHNVNFPISVFDGNSHNVMAAADIILLASGTAALEAMLLKKPMVACYRVSPITAMIVRLFDMIKVKNFTLPNLLSSETLIKELIQEDITPDAIAEYLQVLFDNPEKIKYMKDKFTEIHHTLKKNASDTAAKAILELIKITQKP
ncbi:MAG: lipid-A-disaccharide synthase [Gammaproteobacteria bacterium]|nr:lipid-A-disaccharide synthase [Gammaproteobacteria bacterium]